MEQKKRSFLILILILMVFTVGAALFSEEKPVYENTDEEEESVMATLAPKKDFFSDFRLGRDRRRDEEKELYESIIRDESRPEEAKKEAEEALSRFYRIASLEDQVESILIGRNYDDVIFVVEDTISLLMIRKDKIDESEKESLIRFVSSYGGIPADSITVFTVQ